MNSLIKLLLIVLAVSAILAVPYHVGKNAGKLEVSSAWDKADKERADKVAELTQKNLDLTAAHQTETTRIADELAAQQAGYAKALDALRTDYANRLLQSTTREGIYQRKAQGSAVERDYLASHAARLDRSLEEGRSLVRELRETVGQRDNTIRTLSLQIQADRRLINE